MGLGAHGVILTMVVLTLAMKIAGFSDYYRQFKDRYTLLKNCMLEQVIFLEGKHFGRKSFGIDKKPVFGVANTYYFVMDNVVASNPLAQCCYNIINCTLG